MRRALILASFALPFVSGCGAPPSSTVAKPSNPSVAASTSKELNAGKPANAAAQFDAELKPIIDAETSGEFSSAYERAQRLKEQYPQPEFQPRLTGLLQRLEEQTRKESKLAAAVKDLADEAHRENARVALTDGGPLARTLLRRAVMKAEPPIAQAAVDLLVSLRDEEAPRSMLLRFQQKPTSALREKLTSGLRAVSDLIPVALLPELFAAYKKDTDGLRDLGALAATLVRRSTDGDRAKFNALLGDPGAYDLLKQANLISEVPKDGLVLWLRFDEMNGSAAGNSAGLQNPGGSLNAATWTTGRFDGAVLCNGKNQFVQVDASKLELGKNDSDFSVAFWMCYSPNGGGWRNITHKGNQDNERTFAIWFHCDSDRVWYRISTESNFDEGGCSGCVLQPGSWYHIAYVKQGKTLTLYVNGALDSSVQLNGRSVGNTGPIYIGKDPWYPSVEGRYDDYVVYTRALTAEEVKGMAGNVEKPSAKPLSPPEPAPQF